MDHTTQIIIGALAGLVLGGLVSLVSGMLSLRGLKKGSAGAVTAWAAVRMALDLVTLGGLYLLRHNIPLPFEPTIIGAAVGLSLGGILFAAWVSRRMNGQDKEQL